GAGSTQSIVTSVQGRLSTSQTPVRSGVVPFGIFGGGAAEFSLPSGVSGTPIVVTRHCADNGATQAIIPAMAMNRPVSTRAPLLSDFIWGLGERPNWPPERSR